MVEERIPTMPQVDGTSERIPTMPQADGTSERIPTMPQNASEDGRIATMPQQNMSQTASYFGRLVVTSDIHFTGNKGDSYIIEAQNVVSADSGESQIYGCHKALGTEKYVARVLISVTPDSELEKRISRDKVIKFLESVSEDEYSFILPLVEHGVIETNGKKHYIEIYPFCEEGDLGKRSGQISYEELKKDVIPAVNKALHLFHEAGLVHRDVKPDNLYRYKGKVVIGDFGITCDLRDDGFATDRFKTGTLGYYAPELMSQAAIKASDYYSFGQTLWTLYSGEMMYRNILRRYREYGVEEQRNQINFAMLSNTYYGLDEIGKDDEFFEVLIRGLLQYDPTSRFDYDLVKRWMKGDKSVVHNIAKFEGKSIFQNPFMYRGKKCWDTMEMYQILIKNWEDAKDLLYSGNIKNFFVIQDYDMARKVEEITKSYSTVKNGAVNNGNKQRTKFNDIGLSKFFMLLNDSQTLVWRGTEYTSLNALSYHISEYVNSSRGVSPNEDLDDLLSSDLVVQFYEINARRAGVFNNNLIELLEKIGGMTSSGHAMIKATAYVATMFLLAEDSSIVNYRDCKTIEELVSNIIGIDQNFYHTIGEIMNDAHFYAFLYLHGYEEHVNYLIGKKESGIASANVELLFDFLSNAAEEKSLKEKVLDCYVKKGPSAHLYWWQQNLDMYSYHTEDARAIKNEIENYSLKGSDIGECRERLSQLEILSIRFRGLFADNIFLAQIGLNKGKMDITSTKAEAYWYYDFYGKVAPVGFYAYMEKGGIGRD